MFHLCSRNFPTSTPAPVTYRGEYPPGLGVQVRAQLIILISCLVMSKLASLKNRLRIDLKTALGLTTLLLHANWWRFRRGCKCPWKSNQYFQFEVVSSARKCKSCRHKCSDALSIVFCLNFCQQNFDYPNCLASEKIKGLTANQTTWCLQSCF